MQEDWQEQADCAKSANPDLWWPEHVKDEDAQLALKICAGCPVKRECLQWAVYEFPATHQGVKFIIGGVNNYQLGRIRKEHGISPPKRLSGSWMKTGPDLD